MGRRPRLHGRPRLGTGDQYTGVTRIRYPDGSTWHVVAVLEFRGDRIARNTEYFAPVFEAPAWRAAWVERPTPHDPRVLSIWARSIRR